MSSVSVWVLTIVGVILVSVIVDIIIPDGKMNKFIRGVITVFIVFAMVSPLPFISLDRIDFGSFFDNNIAQVDDQFIDNVNAKKVEEYENMIVDSLCDKGYSNVMIIISSDYHNYEIKINQVFVDLTNLVLNNQSLNIDKYTDIKKIIVDIVDVKEENILFYGG